ncbi:MAG: Bacterial protein of unknown function (DUF883) [Phormidesmis priestleyi Ana]|uniref:Uncharacterized protein n=1 Tax=Phormidesmis priestleyi Ana TaxID=1666911 RepID=A0A0P7ZPQ6_9CYAN|nr:MAG: Bacterial protein of unknown function (DUF883) [Phormidesmis priestleyi Ana]
MIGGIFGTIGKTLGIGKEKYFLELDDAAEESVETIKEAATKAAKIAKSAASDIAEKAQDLIEEASDTAQQSDTAQPQAKSATKSATKSAASDTQAADEKGNTATAAKPVAQPAPSASTTRDPEDIIRAAIAAGGQKTDASGQVIEETKNFSTDYLLSSGSSRRRPGPSLNSFKGMAKEVNPRLK